MAQELERLMGRVASTWRKVTLYALAQNLTRQTLQTWEPPIEGAELLEQIEDRALRQANVLGGSHAFLVETLDDKDHVMGSEVFRVSAELLPNGVSIAHEPANEGGLLAQMMRHLEAQTRTGVLSFEKTSNATLRALESVGKHASQIEDRYVSLINRMQDVVLGEHQARVELAREEASAKTKHMFAERLAGILPEVIGSFTGKVSGTPGAAAAVKAKAAFETLRPEQLETIMSCLDMPQKIAIMGLLKSLAEDAEKHQGAPDGKH